MKASLAATLVLALTFPAHADEVYLTDGSKLVGRVQWMDAAELVMATQFAPELKIKSDAVAGVTTDRKVAITLSSGDRVVGVPGFTPDAGQRITGTAFGDVDLTDQRIVALADEGAPAAAPTPDPVAEQRHKEEMERIKAEHKKEVEAMEAKVKAIEGAWTARVELGLTGSTGNTERTSFRGRAEANRKTERDRFLAFIEGNYAEQNSTRSQNELIGGMRLEVDLDEKWFAFGKLELEYDEFENLDLRATATAGLGRFLIREEDHELKARGGIGYQHESFDDGTTEDDAILELGYDYRLDLHKYFRFTHSLTYYPALEDPAKDYRLRAETAGEVPLGSDENWKLRAGMRNDYDANPRPGVESLDTIYFLNLVHDWK